MKSLFIYGGFLFLCVSFFSCSDNDKNNSNNFATGIVELPALRNGANDVFVRNIPVGLHSGLTIKQNSKMYHVVMSLLMLILLLVHSINVYKQILENKVMTEDIFVLPPTDFIHVR